MTSHATQLKPAVENELAAIEKVLIQGDLSAMPEHMRVDYYSKVCASLGLNPLTKPFDYIKLNNKLVLYAKRDCTDQLRKINGVSVTIASREVVGEIYVVTARARDKSGREDESTGAVPIRGLGGDALANAYMKAETKAKRRVTLSLCGLGMLDETEVADVTGGSVEPGPVAKTPPPEPRTVQAEQGPKDPAQMTKKELVLEILAVAKRIDCTNQELTEWSQSSYGKEARQMTLDELRSFLGELKNEEARSKGDRA
jgi:hypothetical protein